MTIAAFLIALVGPILARIFVSLGVTLVTMVGLVAAVTTLKSLVTSNLGSLPAVALQLGGLFGLWEAIGIVFGAITFVITWRTTKGFMSLAKT